MSPIELILSASVLFQLVAVVLAIRLVRISGGFVAWLILASAFFAQLIRRSYTLYSFFSGDIAHPPNLVSESIGLLISFLMVIGIAAIAPVIRSLRTVNEKINESEKRYRTLFENMAEGYQVIGFDYKYLSVNDAAARQGHRQKEELLGRTMMECYPGIEKAEMFAVLRRCMEQRTAQRMENEFAYPDGSKSWFSLSFEPVSEGVFILSFDITERKLAEQRTRDSEELLNQIIENTPNPMWVSDKAGTVIRINRALRELLHVEDQEIIGKYNVLNDSQVRENNLLPLVESVFRSGKTVNFEIDYQTAREEQVSLKQTVHKILDITIAPIKDLNSQTVFAIALHKDITERKKAETELIAAQRLYRELFENVNVGVLRSTPGPEGTFIDINPAMVKLFEADSREQLMAIHPSEIYWDASQRKIVTDTIVAKGFANEEIKFKTLKGKQLWCHINSVKRTDANGKFYFDSTIEDISARKRAEEAIQRNRRELDARNRIAEVFLTEADKEMYPKVLAIILEIVGSKYGVFGYLDEEGGLVVPTMTRTVWDKCQVPDKRFFFPRGTWGNSSWPRAIREKRTICLNEISNLTPEGHIPIIRHISLPLIHLGEVVGLLQVANKETDYTEEDLALLETIGRAIAPVLDARLNRERQEAARKQAEALLKKTLEDLKHSNTELEQFAYVTSHDMQEPLRMVASYLQLIEKRYKGKLDADADEFIGYAVDGAVRMKAMINDLLNFSRLGTRGNEPGPTDCQVVLSAALINLGVTIEENRAEVTNDRLPIVNGDETQLVRLFQNLIDNAIKFRGTDTPRIHISCEAQNGSYLFSIRDNGIGIDPQYFDRIFIVFQRLHERDQYPGTGIGLAMCKKIVERHHGKIWIESEPGKGTTFYFTLPIPPSPL